MSFSLRTLVITIAAFATMAPVCVLGGGETTTTTATIELGPAAIVEVIGENAEVQVLRATSDSLELTATFHNGEFVDFFTQSLTPDPSSHFVISATISAGGSTTANSIIELRIPEGMQLVIQTTNRPISIEEAILTSASLTTTNGEISVKNSTGDFDLNTTNSEVTVQSVDGNVNIATTNAHVWFDCIVAAGMNSISTTNGDIAVRLRDGSNVFISGSTHNGEVTVDGGASGVTKDGDTAMVELQIADGVATLAITNGPGAIYINPETIAVFDGDS
ncbi:MAG: DUF4097 family beta strand repeat protein [Chloroflexi bacterium]|nr:DUF4097 family beta strand repeat protein [Chloroflexota bacterium]